MSVLRAAQDGGSGEAADTGSMVGRAIELWHRMGEPTSVDLLAALEQAKAERAEKFPRAVVSEVGAMFAGYVADPRNRGTVVAELQEAEVRLLLPPAPEDPTGQPVSLVGHIDQARRDPETGQLYVWDVKSGKGAGLEMVYSYAWQLAAYALACTETFGEPVLPGGIIRVRAYEAEAKRAEKLATPTKSGKPRKARARKTTAEEPAALFYTPWSLDECRQMLDTVAFEVAHLRRGTVATRPGIACQWCPGGGPNNCTRRLDAVDVSRVLVNAEPLAKGGAA